MTEAYFKSSQDAVTARAKNEDNPARQKPFASAAKQVTRRASKPLGPGLRNPKLSREQRLSILEKRYPEAPEKLLEVIANYRTPSDFAKAIFQLPFASGQAHLVAISVQLNRILNGKHSGWDNRREPNRIIQAAANLTDRPVDDFIPLLDDGERLDDLRRRYPNANDALLQVIVPFKVCNNFARQLLDVAKSLKSGRTTFNAANMQLRYILTRHHESDFKRKREPDGSRRPNDVIMAVAAFTGLDHRYFLRPEDGGISLKRGERIAYDGETGQYSIIGTAPKAAPRLAFPAA